LDFCVGACDKRGMTETAAAPIPAIPASIPDLVPGWKTSEAYITLLTMILGAIPSSGLTADAPLLAKIVGMAIAGLSALNYTAQRTALKRAHLAARAAGAPMQLSSGKAAQIAASAAIVAIVLLIGFVGGCTKTGSGATSPIAAGGNAFLQCGKQDLTQLVGDKSLLATVATDLLGENYAQAVGDLIGKIGNDAVGCAVLAVDAVAGAEKSGSPTPHALALQGSRAKELIAKYNWRSASAAPAPGASTAPAPGSAAPAPAPAAAKSPVLNPPPAAAATNLAAPPTPAPAAK
jgi:hypothetical protein